MPSAWYSSTRRSPRVTVAEVSKLQARVNFGRDTARNDGQNLAAKAHQQPVYGFIQRPVFEAGHRVFQQGLVVGFLHRLEDQRRIGRGILRLELGQRKSPVSATTVVNFFSASGCVMCVKRPQGRKVGQGPDARCRVNTGGTGNSPGGVTIMPMKTMKAITGVAPACRFAYCAAPGPLRLRPAKPVRPAWRRASRALRTVAHTWADLRCAQP